MMTGEYLIAFGSSGVFIFMLCFWIAIYVAAFPLFTKTDNRVAEIWRSLINIFIIELLAVDTWWRGQWWWILDWNNHSDSVPHSPVFMAVISNICAYNSVDFVHMSICWIKMVINFDPAKSKEGKGAKTRWDAFLQGLYRYGPFLAHHLAVIAGTLMQLATTRYFVLSMLGCLLEVTSALYAFRNMIKLSLVSFISLETYDPYYKASFVIIRSFCVVLFLLHYQSDLSLGINIIYMISTASLALFSCGYMYLMWFGGSGNRSSVEKLF